MEETVEEQRRGNRDDAEDKAALVTTKRCVVALRLVACLMTHFQGGLRRDVSLTKCAVQLDCSYGRVTLERKCDIL